MTVKANRIKNGLVIEPLLEESGTSTKKWERIPIRPMNRENAMVMNSDARNTRMGTAARFKGLFRGNQLS
jgi:hypothetical protein